MSHPSVPLVGTVTPKIEQRFWVKTKADHNSKCILWSAAYVENQYGNKYGRFTFNPPEEDIKARRVLVHRFVLYMVDGVDPGETVDHLCFTTLCVNPWHLQPNVTRVDQNKRQKKNTSFFCKYGHTRTPENTYWFPDGTRGCYPCQRDRDKNRYKEKYAKEKLKNTHSSEMRDFASQPKLNWDLVREIRARYAAGDGSQRTLAREYFVSQPLIGMIVRGESWKEEDDAA